MFMIYRVPLLVVAALSTIPLLAGGVNARGVGGSAHGAIAAPGPGIGRSTYSGATKVQARSGGRSSTPSRPTGTSSSPSGSVTSGPPAAPVAPSASAPPSQVGSPAPQPSAIAPLSPQLPTQFATGGSTGASNLALSPGPSSGSPSPSESAPSAPGGGGKSLADCMGFWEKETHMSKTEWRAACKRSLQEVPSVLR
jgi:hypothetical protein